MKSDKEVIPLSQVIKERIFNLPKTMANSIDTVSGKPCIWVGVNGKPYVLIVEEPIPIPYNVFCVLKDNGVLNPYEKYIEGEEFRPL